MFDIIKFLSGFAFWKGDKAGKLVFYIIIIASCLLIYHKAFEPKQVTKIERIETQIVNQCPKDTRWIKFDFSILGQQIKLGF